MTFHEILKTIVGQYGPEILKERRVVNILKDYNAFEDMPVYRGPLTALINDGHVAELIDTGAWTPKALTIGARIQKHWAIPAPIADAVVQSVAFALGYIPAVAPSSSQSALLNNGVPLPSPIHPKGDSADFLLTTEELLKKDGKFQDAYFERAMDYLDSIVEYKEDFPKTRGFQVRVFSDLSFDSFYRDVLNLSWNIEITGPIKLRTYDDLESYSLCIAAYNHQNKLVGIAEYSLESSKDIFRVVESWNIPDKKFKTVGNIARIVVYIQK